MKIIFSPLLLFLLTALLACSPDTEALLLGGKALLEEEKYAQAIDRLDSVIEQQPKWSVPYQMRGIAYFEQQSFEQAITDFSRAIQLDSSSYKNYYYRGNAYQEVEAYQNALADYDTAIRLKPELKGLFINRGVVFYMLGEYQEALQAFNQAYQLDSNDERILLNRAKTNIALQDGQAALEDLQLLEATKPESAETFYLLGIAYLQNQQQEEGCSAWQQAANLGSTQAQQAIEDFCEK